MVGVFQSQLSKTKRGQPAINLDGFARRRGIDVDGLPAVADSSEAEPGRAVRVMVMALDLPARTLFLS